MLMMMKKKMIEERRHSYHCGIPWAQAVRCDPSSLLLSQVCWRLRLLCSHWGVSSDNLACALPRPAGRHALMGGRHKLS